MAVVLTGATLAELVAGAAETLAAALVAVAAEGGLNPAKDASPAPAAPAACCAVVQEAEAVPKPKEEEEDVAVLAAAVALGATTAAAAPARENPLVVPLREVGAVVVSVFARPKPSENPAEGAAVASWGAPCANPAAADVSGVPPMLSPPLRPMPVPCAPPRDFVPKDTTVAWPAFWAMVLVGAATPPRVRPVEVAPPKLNGSLAAEAPAPGPPREPAPVRAPPSIRPCVVVVGVLNEKAPVAPPPNPKLAVGALLAGVAAPLAPNANPPGAAIPTGAPPSWNPVAAAGAAAGAAAAADTEGAAAAVEGAPMADWPNENPVLAPVPAPAPPNENPDDGAGAAAVAGAKLKAEPAAGIWAPGAAAVGAPAPPKENPPPAPPG